MTLPTTYQEFIATSRYARWLEDEGRRETWPESVDRYIKFFQYKVGVDALPCQVWRELHDGILNLEVMPSMRCMMTAGRALERDEIAGYNCSYTPIDHVRVFDEVLYILMCGTGVGFSVERQYVSKLPEIAEDFHPTDTVIKVRDSKIGWADALRELLALLYQGRIPGWDLSALRPKGAVLKTFGGRSAGPEPLNMLFHFAVSTFTGAAGRKLTSRECHDLMCMVGEAVVSGGVRRSALISLSNLSDDRMRHAKDGNWWDTHGHRALANNSAVYTEKPDMGTFMREWTSLYESKSGERGIFNRQASALQAARNHRRKEYPHWGTNPCSEIILRAQQLCNLSEAVVRPDDTLEDLRKKVRLATILGTLQSTLTNFRYLRKKWRDNTEEERLLGVSLTGLMDHPVLRGPNDTAEEWLLKLKRVAVDTNEAHADMLGIPQSTAITCVKPSGTVSQLVDSASGLHTRFSQYYIRTVRNSITDPVSRVLIDAGVPHEPDITNPTNTLVFSFPMKSPDTSRVAGSMTAIEQLEYWLFIQDNWCEHKPSCTVYVGEDEWMEVGAWVYEHFDRISGVSFLPRQDHVYQQAPYQEITKTEYDEWTDRMKDVKVDWSKLAEYEDEDRTVGAQELACVSGYCEI